MFFKNEHIFCGQRSKHIIGCNLETSREREKIPYNSHSTPVSNEKIP